MSDKLHNVVNQLIAEIKSIFFPFPPPDPHTQYLPGSTTPTLYSQNLATLQSPTSYNQNLPRAASLADLPQPRLPARQHTLQEAIHLAHDTAGYSDYECLDLPYNRRDNVRWLSPKTVHPAPQHVSWHSEVSQQNTPMGDSWSDDSWSGNSWMGRYPQDVNSRGGAYIIHKKACKLSPPSKAVGALREQEVDLAAVLRKSPSPVSHIPIPQNPISQSSIPQSPITQNPIAQSLENIIQQPEGDSFDIPQTEAEARCHIKTIHNEKRESCGSRNAKDLEGALEMSVHT